ncbi:MAG: hypothetical protein JJ900_00565 [Rhodospirillales bacterium]|nr:hypothetical protein [Rhodospirillales bacterium]MBO6785309.1 hypothetical protein [Rhodospirillales bacterium]
MKATFEILDDLSSAYADIAFVTKLWEDARGKHFAPPWAAIDLMQVPSKAIPRICVVDVVPSPLDFIYRFWGTGITQMHDLDATRQSVTTVPPAEYSTILFKQYELVVTARTPMTYVCQFEDDKGLERRYVVRRFPLSDDGETVTAVLSMEEYGENNEDLKKLFGQFAP